MLVRGARQLITLRGAKNPRRGTELNQLHIIPDGALLIRGGLLQEVGTSRRLENLKEAREALEINAAGRVVMPGFVDSHTHLLFPPPGAPAGDLFSAARALNATTGMQLRLRAVRYLDAMARHGTTTVEIKTGSGAGISGESKILRVLAELKNDVLDIVATFLFRPASGSSAEDCIRVCHELLPRFAQRRWCEFADLDCGAAARPELIDGYFKLAADLGLRRKLHTADASLAAAAVSHKPTTIDHLEHVSAADFEVLRRSEAIATLLPCACFFKGGSHAPGRALMDAGIPVALATAFNEHESPCLNMQTAIAMACHDMGLTTAEAISAATINGAYAVGRGASIGSFEPGKFADLLLLNIGDYRDLSHCLGTNLVHVVMKRGEIIYREAEVGPHPVESPLPGW